MAEISLSTLSRRGTAVDRLQFVFGALAYVAALQVCYIVLIAPVWGYGGFEFTAPPLLYWISFSIVALIPSAWMPTRIERPSQWLYLYVYIAVYVPSCIIPMFISPPTRSAYDELIPLTLMLLVCMSLIEAGYLLPVVRLPRLRVDARLFWAGVAVLTLAAYALDYRVFGGSLRLVSGKQVVAQRLLGRETLASAGNSSLIGYALVWPAYGVNALLLALGVWRRNWVAFAAAVVGQLFLFSANAARGAVATIPLALLVWFALRQKRLPFAVFWMLGIAIGVMAITLGCMLPGVSRPVIGSASWFVLRTFVGSGYLTGIYHQFFAHHPQTLFSQVRGFGWVGQNPYGVTSLGRVIGAWMGQPENNANANFLADGYASYGLLGMLFVTVVTTLVFYVIDSLLRRSETELAVIALAPHALGLADLPVFTALLGGGLGFLVLLLYLNPPARRRGARSGVQPAPARTAGGFEGPPLTEPAT